MARGALARGRARASPRSSASSTAIVGELRRRLGGPFTTEELVELYDEGTSWVTDVAVAAAPENPEAWDVRMVGDAAFAALRARGHRLRRRPARSTLAALGRESTYARRPTASKPSGGRARAASRRPSGR